MDVDFVSLAPVSIVIITVRTSVDVTSPRRSARATPSKYRSLPAASNEMSTPTKPSSSTAEKSENDSSVERNPDVQDGSDSDVTPKKKSKVTLKIDSDEEEEHPSSTVKSGGSPPAQRHRRGLRDLKVIGTVPNVWSSDEDSDELPNIGT